jgi:hypothetical protein
VLDESEWSTPSPGYFNPGKDPIPIVQEAGRSPGQLWPGAENIAPSGDGTSNRLPVSIHSSDKEEKYFFYSAICLTYFNCSNIKTNKVINEQIISHCLQVLHSWKCVVSCCLKGQLPIHVAKEDKPDRHYFDARMYALFFGPVAAICNYITSKHVL